MNAKAKDELIALIDEYLLLKDALVMDDFNNANEVTSSLLLKLNKINMSEFKGKAHDVWMRQKHCGW